MRRSMFLVPCAFVSISLALMPTTSYAALPVLFGKQLLQNIIFGLTPEERDQLVGGLAEGLREASPQDRKLFRDGFGAGFFPTSVVDAVRAKMADR